MTDEHDRPAVDPANSTDNRRIIRVHAIAMQLLEIGCQNFQVVTRVWPHRVARDLCDLPGTKFGEDALGQRLALALEPFDLLTDIDLGIVADETQFFDLGFELCYRLFEIEKLEIHLFGPDC